MGGRRWLWAGAVMVGARLRVEVGSGPERTPGITPGISVESICGSAADGARYAGLRIPRGPVFGEDGGAFFSTAASTPLMINQSVLPRWLASFCLAGVLAAVPLVAAGSAKQLWTAKLPGDAKWH